MSSAPRNKQNAFLTDNVIVCDLGIALGTVSNPMHCPGVPSTFVLFVGLLLHVGACILL